MRIVSAASALPEYRYPQHVITQAFARHWGDRLTRPELLHRLHAHAGVDYRHLAYPLERYEQFRTWGETNAAWFEAAQELGERALDAAIERAGIARREIDALFVVSITGVASPSLDARLINRMELRSDIKRTPIFGLGCVAGATGLTRAADYVLAYPRQTAALLAVELCSLTVQGNDLSTANLIATGLFGDGAAAVIVAGSERRGEGPRILASRSRFYPGSEEIMGWNISEEGFRIVLSPKLPEMIKRHLAADVDSFLFDHGLTRRDIGSWLIHTGGPKVLRTTAEALELPDRELEASWECLKACGNLSSASVLLVLEDAMMTRRPPRGTTGLLIAMGPGFCAELLLMRW